MFVLEKKYSDCGIEEQNYIYPNPNLLEENGIARNIEKFFPLKTHLIPCPSLQKRLLNINQKNCILKHFTETAVLGASLFLKK